MNGHRETAIILHTKRSSPGLVERKQLGDCFIWYCEKLTSQLPKEMIKAIAWNDNGLNLTAMHISVAISLYFVIIKH
ncbi:MAG: hypothetical protein A2509_06925 [Candidatus Edwardsbacteria bacterium RIFOXYD12_FULL_50_11]|uniref:Uncharacterized protein n=1 Tax=Candidatus Edwardsbacteria bacterium GWF2_54_11 TaxID=1817851 RepID=A0A1F5RGI3_9BACT|nr:MAG: hypothetical protein A2502_09690 [Candidatus Edwardsbacteria bacterium RifOxyC12_full_54_24]OGF06883.1 MAG: hypothetical protein A2273_01370 [Candidatus Edwardsbacteria bacterium RifOxyA12_full_54_48]OGF10833.1 MAG: hypothetical protein A3K15_06740 [Candidatus Edwardsbacteria bacterium GWE2_54_12]OGF13233.1 MAG: hypothetical protein A2024_09550 [Candidatus Edwardsbacteria bacterium GWF2_54_11]OGF15613.1 MAG: hypothetical protein A2509_06925 [Candidatus Edwardsbacteria bacterium RIFOXYD1